MENIPHTPNTTNHETTPKTSTRRELLKFVGAMAAGAVLPIAGGMLVHEQDQSNRHNSADKTLPATTLDGSDGGPVFLPNGQSISEEGILKNGYAKEVAEEERHASEHDK